MATTKKSEALIGYGTKIEFLTYGFLGHGTNFRSSRGQVDAVDVTTFDSPAPESDREWGGVEKIANTIGDPGRLPVGVVWQADQKLPPIGQEDSIRVTFPLKSGVKQPTVWSGQGLLASVDVSAETRTAYTAEVVIEASGVWTETPAARV